ncbi:MAG TPA: chemotaxis response regulator protein-glutamate methylesterase [Candidatus Bathyarchaeia archaeon]|nr:chemotaxis response regulator protein-glutamate methylesterase [Candidatus Bathyarchaeia archaeon]
MSKIRVLVVDDSAFMRKVITDLLNQDPSIEVVDRARNGIEGIEKVKQLKPDVVTLDIEMPLMNGLDALQQLMKECPLPVVMLSSLTKEGADATIRALELGAFDFITKPSGSISLDIHKVADDLLEKVKAAAQTKGRQRNIHISPIKKVPPTLEKAAAPEQKAPVTKEPTRAMGGRAAKLVAVGTSTGGPKALQTLLTALPASMDAPLVIVQHMPPGFTKSLAQRLDTLCAIRVVEAEDGQWIEPGTAYIAPGGYHFEVHQAGDRLKVHLHQAEPRGGHRPSVDVLFESVSGLTNLKKWAIIMTGMGSDGTKGLKQMKEKDQVFSIIEDESSCIVFGMPRAAIQAGLADKVVPLDKIAETLVKLVN